MLCACVATLALGLRPRQGVARLQAKRKEAQESRQRHGKVASQKEGSSGVKAKALEGCGPGESPGVNLESKAVLFRRTTRAFNWRKDI